MKREDFKIKGIPEGYRVYDVDLTPSGRPVAVFGSITDKDAPVYTIFREAQIMLPENSLQSWVNGLMSACDLRCLSEDRILFIHGVAHRNVDWAASNAWVWNSDGTLERKFRIGVGVIELVAGEMGILATYGDYTIFGHEGPNKEGIAIFDLKGEFKIGFRGDFSENVADGIAGCWSADGAAFVAYYDYDWMPIIARIDVATCDYAKWELPRVLGRAGAMTVSGDRVLLGAFQAPPRPETPGRLERWLNRLWKIEELERWLNRLWKIEEPPQLLPSHIVEWHPGQTEWAIVGESGSLEPWGLRGLPGGRFIAVQPDGYTILSFE